MAENPAVSSKNDNLHGQDLSSLLDQLYGLEFPENDNRSNQTSHQQSAHPKVDSSEEKEILSGQNSESHSSSMELHDFGLVDSLTLTNCTKLVLSDDGEQSDDEEDVMEFPRDRQSSSLQVHRRTGARRGEGMTYTVLTKTS